jgi:hypothetical protein
MENSNPSSQVKEQYYLSGDIKSMHHFPNMHHTQAYDKFSILKDNAECFHQCKTSTETTDCSVLCAKSFRLQIVDGKETQWFFAKKRIGQSVLSIGASRGEKTLLRCRLHGICREATERLSLINSRGIC